MLLWRPSCCSVELAQAVQAHADSIPGSAQIATRMLEACRAHSLAVQAMLEFGQVCASFLTPEDPCTCTHMHVHMCRPGTKGVHPLLTACLVRVTCLCNSQPDCTVFMTVQRTSSNGLQSLSHVL